MNRMISFEPNKPDSIDVAHIIHDAAEYANVDCYRTDLLSVNHINVLLHVIELLQEEKQEQTALAQANIKDWTLKWKDGDINFVPEMLDLINSMSKNPSPLLEHVKSITPSIAE